MPPSERTRARAPPKPRNKISTRFRRRSPSFRMIIDRCLRARVSAFRMRETGQSTKKGGRGKNPKIRGGRGRSGRAARKARVFGVSKKRAFYGCIETYITKPLITNRITRVLGPGGRRAAPRAGKKSVGNARSARRETRGIRGTRAGSTRRPPHSRALEAGFEPGGSRRSGARKTRSATSLPGSAESSRRRRAKRVRGFGRARRVPPGCGHLCHSARAWRVCCVCAHRRPRG